MERKALSIIAGILLTAATGFAQQAPLVPRAPKPVPAIPAVPVALPVLPAPPPLSSLSDFHLAPLPAIPANLWQEMEEQDPKVKEKTRASEIAEREEELRDREQERKDREQERLDRQEELYDEGQEAMEEGHWDRARDRFAQLYEMKGKRADAALYYFGYSLHKLGRKDEALAVLSRFDKEFPQSRWLKDAKALMIEVKNSSGVPVKPEEEQDCELKSLALQSIMNSDPDRAVPTLEKFLQTNSKCPKLPDRALFVLAQMMSRSDKARDLMTRIAKGESNPELQRKAIRYISLFADRSSRQVLADVYASSADESVKKEIIHGWMLSGERDRILTAARSEKDPALRGEAIRQLGLLGARGELWQLYQSESTAEIKSQIIQSLFIGGDFERLSELAKAEKDPELRRKAIRNLGLTGKRDTSTATLLSIYSTDKDPAVRKEVLNAFFLQNNATALVQLAKQESDPEMKKAIVQKLSIMNSKEAMDYLMELLNK